MKRQRSEKWNDWRTKVARKCDDLARNFGGRAGAVALRDIALHRRITRIEFRPLLVEGGLGRRGGGFVMFVKCAAEQAAEFTARFHESGGRDLPARTRFTIAHEIAHTLFFDLTPSKPIPLFEASHPAELESLESACNLGANELLLPSHRFEEVLQTSDLLQPEKLLEVAKRFGISVDVLMVRLSRTRMWGSNHGAAAIVSVFGGELKLDAFAADRYSESLFPADSEQLRALEILRDDRLSLFGGAQSSVENEIACRNGAKQAYTAACAPINPKGSRHILSFRLKR